MCELQQVRWLKAESALRKNLKKLNFVPVEWVKEEGHNKQSKIWGSLGRKIGFSPSSSPRGVSFVQKHTHTHNCIREKKRHTLAKPSLAGPVVCLPIASSTAHACTRTFIPWCGVFLSVFCHHQKKWQRCTCGDENWIFILHGEVTTSSTSSHSRELHAHMRCNNHGHIPVSWAVDGERTQNRRYTPQGNLRYKSHACVCDKHTQRLLHKEHTNPTSKPPTPTLLAPRQHQEGQEKRWVWSQLWGAFNPRTFTLLSVCVWGQVGW